MPARDSAAVESPRAAFPWRGMGLGAVMSLLVVSTAIFYNSRLARQGISNDMLAACAVFFLIVICGVVNPLLKLADRRLGFSGPDLLVAFAMMLVASAIPSWGLLQMWVATVTSWHYFASPENMWAELFIPYLPQSAVVRDLDAIRYLYEGLPLGETIPWASWILPVLFWFPFFIALYLGMIAMMVLFRKQWVEHERLAFPMMQFPAELCKEGEEGEIATPFFKSKAVWLGAAIPFLILSYNSIAAFLPGLNAIPLRRYIGVMRRMAYYCVYLNFPAMGFAYLVSLDISLGLWLFHVVSKLQAGAINMLTGGVLTNSQVLYCAGYPVNAHEGFGSMVVLFFSGLWIARKRLGRIFGLGLRMKATDEDSHEIMSYRAAVWATMLCWFVLAVYMHETGLTWFQAGVFIFVAIIVFYAVTRVICEGGVGFARAVYIPNAFLINQFGSNVLGPQGISALGFSFVWSGDLRTIVMTQAAQGMRLTESIDRRRPLLWCMLLAVVIALFGSLAASLHLGYKYGLFNCMGSWPVWPCGTHHWRNVAGFIKTPRVPDPLSWVFMGIGGVVMYLLIFLRQRFVWWPIHYIGLPVCGSLPMNYLWFSVFLAWMIKALILKFGTTWLYQRSRMFFLGMIFGSLAASGIWTIIGVIAQHEATFTTGVTLG